MSSDTWTFAPANADCGEMIGRSQLADDYQRLRNLDRRAMHVSDLNDEELAALARVDIAAEAARYNHETT